MSLLEPKEDFVGENLPRMERSGSREPVKFPFSQPEKATDIPPSEAPTMAERTTTVIPLHHRLLEPTRAIQTPPSLLTQKSIQHLPTKQNFLTSLAMGSKEVNGTDGLQPLLGRVLGQQELPKAA